MAIWLYNPFENLHFKDLNDISKDQSASHTKKNSELNSARNEPNTNVNMNISKLFKTFNYKITSNVSSKLISFI